MSSPQQQRQRRPGSPQSAKAYSWAHFLAGAAGGVSATILTAPLDIVKTRLQSTLYADKAYGYERSAPQLQNGLIACLKHTGKHFQKTLSMIAVIRRNEGTFALFRGLGPNLAGYVPATGLKFLFYGNAKPMLVAINGKENAWTHLQAGIIAGVFTCTATNPFWVIKTRLQLDRALKIDGRTHSRQYRNSVDCIRQTLQQEGMRGLYRGLSASYIGTIETALQWVLYEQLKVAFRAPGLADPNETQIGGFLEPFHEAIAAGSSKLVAAISLYPHEVLRTRLREAPKSGTSTTRLGLWQCLQSILAKEGAVALYGGLPAHLLRVVPSSAVIFSVYEFVLRLVPQ